MKRRVALGDGRANVRQSCAVVESRVGSRCGDGEHNGDHDAQTVVIPQRPAQGGVVASCDGFVVTATEHKAYCTVTVAVADPTLHNTGWRLSLNATDFTCTCGGTLPPNALIVESSSGPVVISGQPVDSKGGPNLQVNSVGRSPDGSRPLMVAKPGFGNGAYTMTLTLRLSYPAKTKPGLYVPAWVVNVSS